MSGCELGKEGSASGPGVCANAPVGQRVALAFVVSQATPKRSGLKQQPLFFF